MAEPAQRIALCLSYMRGPKVDDWVMEKIGQLQRAIIGDPANGIAPTHQPDDEALWGDFAAQLERGFLDTVAQSNAYTDLQHLRMEGTKIDEYIARFEHLLARARWGHQDQGSIDVFCKGLPKWVQGGVIDHTDQLPNTLEGWEAAARKEVE